ncbi:MAG: DUF3347 domain-containing protein [bacterium]
MKKIFVTTMGIFLIVLGFAMSGAAAEKSTKANSPKNEKPKAADTLASNLMTPYLAMRAALAADNVSGVDKNAAVLISALKDGLSKAKKEKKPKDYLDSLEVLITAAEYLNGKDLGIGHCREYFGEFSDTFVSWMRSNASAKDTEKYQLFYCPMARHNWLQKTGESIENPFYGASMAECGERHSFSASAAKK